MNVIGHDRIAENADSKVGSEVIEFDFYQSFTVIEIVPGERIDSHQ